jgi:PII-like signaling protein
MLSPGPAKKVTIYLNEDTISANGYLSEAILSLLLQAGVAGATVIRPVSGFGSHHQLHSPAGGIDTDLHMPVRIEFIESAINFAVILPQLEDLVVDGLIEAHDTTILKSAAVNRAGSKAGEPS